MLNILIGTWLMISAFALGLGGALFWVTFLAGVFVVVLEAASFWRMDARYGTALVGLILLAAGFATAFASTTVTGGRDTGFWNAFFCGMALVILSVAFRSRVKSGPWVPGANRRAEVR